MTNSKDYSKEIVELGDGLIGIPVNASQQGDMAAVFKALMDAPTPKKASK